MADSGDRFMKGLVLGGIIGGALGILFAPKSGKETREELSEETDKLLSQVKIDIENAKKAALKSFDESKDRLVEKLIQEDEPRSKSEPPKKEEKPEEKRPKRKRTRRTKSD